MTTEPGQLDETLLEEDVQDEAAETEPQFYTRNEVLGLIQAAKTEAADEAFRRAQARMEGELNSQKDRRFNELEARMAELQSAITERQRQALIEQATAGFDEEQQRAMRLLLQQQSQGSVTANPSQVVEQTVQQPQTYQEQDTVRQLEEYVRGFGIEARWGDQNPVWNNLTSTDTTVFMRQLNTNISTVLRQPSAPAPSTNGTERRGNPPPVVGRTSRTSAIKTAEDFMDAHIRGDITTEEYKRDKGKYGITT